MGEQWINNELRKPYNILLLIKIMWNKSYIVFVVVIAAIWFCGTKMQKQNMIT